MEQYNIGKLLIILQIAFQGDHKVTQEKVLELVKLNYSKLLQAFGMPPYTFLLVLMTLGTQTMTDYKPFNSLFVLLLITVYTCNYGPQVGYTLVNGQLIVGLTGRHANNYSHKFTKSNLKLLILTMAGKNLKKKESTWRNCLVWNQNQISIFFVKRKESHPLYKNAYTNSIC